MTSICDTCLEICKATHARESCPLYKPACEYYMEVVAGISVHGCILRRKPTECEGNKRHCWYPDLLAKVGSVGAREKDK
jgi:hypothetical protein